MTLNCDLEKTITQNPNEDENMKDGNLFERVHLNINKTNLTTLEKNYSLINILLLVFLKNYTYI